MGDDAAARNVPSTYDRLAERFPASEHKTRNQGGATLTYVTGEMVISRLNAVLGFDWSFRVLREGQTEVEAWVLAELTATIDGKTVTREHYGNQDLARGQRATSDLFKSAATDALKKAATTIGVGLYLYDEDERREVEAEMRQARRPDPTPRSAAPAAPAHPAAASTPAASGAAPSSSSTTATPAPTEPTPLKTKLELVADLKRGIEYARSLGLDPAEPDAAKLNRAQLEDMISALRSQCRIALAERKKAQAS